MSNPANITLYAPVELGSTGQFSATPKITIVPKQANYVVVLDKFGDPPTAYPILEFDIKGPPNYIVDVQVSRDAPALLTGGPGLTNAWDKNQPPEARITQLAFSSWTNGDQGIILDASGKATYGMPLNWWKDLARLPLEDFGTANIRYRAVAWPGNSATPTAWSTKDGAIAPKILVRSNLLTFELIESGANQVIYASGATDFIDWGYNDDERRKFVLMKFTVREANTTEMYTIVQWKTGSSQNWPRPNPADPWYNYVMSGGLWCYSNDPVSTIDSLDTDPRYPQSNSPGIPGAQWYPALDNRTAMHVDTPGGGIDARLPIMQSFLAKDYDTKLCLNFEVPNSVPPLTQGPTTVVDGKTVWKTVRLVIGPPEPFVIDHKTWKARILQRRKADLSVEVTYPDTYAGP